MASKLEYLKLAIRTRAIENLDWYYYCFAVPLLKEENLTNKKIGHIFTKIDGLYFINEKNEQEKIIDHNPNEPLYRFSDVIEVDSTYSQYITSKIKTKIGNLIFNTLIIFPSFKNKLPYINDSPIVLPKIEKHLASVLKNDNEAKENDIVVSEFIEFMNRITFLTNFADIVNIAATYKSITSPPDIDKKRKELIEKYKNKLNDPVASIELEKELESIDKEYLSDDPAAKNIFNKKSTHARKKFYLMFGNDAEFDPNYKPPILQPLKDGLDTDPESFVRYINSLRFGSLSRGRKTALAGYMAKILTRSLSPITIQNTDCGTNKGIKRTISKDSISKIVGRTVKISGKWITISSEEEASKLVDKEIEMRSPMYCKLEGNNICLKCFSEKYKNMPYGVTNIMSEVAGIVLNMYMKLMHMNVIDLTKIKNEDLIT